MSFNDEYSPEKAEEFLQGEHKQTFKDYLRFYLEMGLEKAFASEKYKGNEEKQINWLCKAALKSPCMKHFMLDEINLVEVFNQESAHYKSHTSRELRYIFRHWQEFTPGTIMFYENNKEILNLFEWLQDKKSLDSLTNYMNSKYIPLNNIVIYPFPISLSDYHSHLKNTLDIKPQETKTQPRTPENCRFFHVKTAQTPIKSKRQKTCYQKNEYSQKENSTDNSPIKKSAFENQHKRKRLPLELGCANTSPHKKRFFYVENNTAPANCRPKIRLSPAVKPTLQM